MDSETADELYRLLASTEPIPFGGADVFLEPEQYLAVNELERSGAEATRTRLRSRYRIAADKAIELLDELRMLLPCDRSATAALPCSGSHWTSPAAPTLEALVELVQRDGRRIFVTRDGGVLAELVP